MLVFTPRHRDKKDSLCLEEAIAHGEGEGRPPNQPIAMKWLRWIWIKSLGGGVGQQREENINLIWIRHPTNPH